MAWDPAGQIEEMAKNKLSNRLGVKRELKTLPSHLAEGEEVLNLSSGMYDGANGLVILTDRRVIFYSAGLTKSRFEDFSYSKVSSVQHKGGMMFGEVAIYSSGNKAELKQMLKDRAKEIAEYIRNRISDDPPSSAPSAPAVGLSSDAPAEDAFEKLRKLGELKNAGVISEAEFEEKKKQFLSDL